MQYVYAVWVWYSTNRMNNINIVLCVVGCSQSLCATANQILLYYLMLDILVDKDSSLKLILGAGTKL